MICTRHRQYQYQVLRYWGFEWYWYWYWYWGFQFCWYWYWYWYWGSEVLKYWGIEIWCGIGIESDQIPAASRFQRFKIIQMSFHIACMDMFLFFYRFSVGPFMHLQIATLVKSFFTFGTGKWFLSCVGPFMPIKMNPFIGFFTFLAPSSVPF